MIIRANLGADTRWFEEQSLKATHSITENVQNKLYVAVTHNPMVQACIIGFDFFSEDLMNIVRRCLYTGIVIKLCDQSSKETEQFEPLMSFPRGHSNYEQWPIAYTQNPGPDDLIVWTTTRLKNWQKENNKAYAELQEKKELRALQAELLWDMRQLTQNPEVQKNLNRYARKYHLADKEQYPLAVIDVNGEYARDFCLDVYEMQLPNTARMTAKEILLAWYQCLYYLSVDIKPSKQVELAVKYAETPSAYRSLGFVSVFS